MSRTLVPHPSISKTPLPLDADERSTVCVLCSHGCGLQVDVRGGRIEKVRPDPSNPITKGYSCNKAVTIGRYADHQQRVKAPLEKQPDGSFREVSWERAISEIARRLGEIVRTHGPRSFALVGVGGQANHCEAPWALGFMTGLGSRRWFNAYAQEKTQNHLVDMWMMDAPPGVMLHPDTERCAYLLVLGTNPRISNRGHAANETFRALQKDASRRVVVVDPRETETTRGADRHVRVRPGQDVYLLLGLAAHMVREGLHDRTYLRRHARDTDALLGALGAIDVEQMAAKAGVAVEVLKEEARLFAGARGAAILWDLGIEQGRFSTLNAYLIRVLLALSGNLGKTGGNLFHESFNPPSAGIWSRQPEKARVSGIESVRALGSYGMFSPSLFPEEVLTHHPERIRATIVTGSNPFLSFSDTARWRQAFDALELSVVIEPAMTETARAADYVLPAPVSYEKWDASFFPQHFPALGTQFRPPILPAPEGALPEPEIFVRLAEAMDLFGRPPRLVRSLARRAGTERGRAAFSAAVMAAAAKSARLEGIGTQNRVLYWSYRLLGAHLDSPSHVALWFMCIQNSMARRAAVVRRLGKEHRLRSPFGLANEIFRRVLEHPEGVVVAEFETDGHLERNVGYRDGRVRLSVDAMLGEIRRALSAPEKTSEAFPLVLAAGLRTRWTANTIHRDHAWRKGKGPHCSLGVAPADADRLGLSTGDTARLTTERGSRELPVLVDEKLVEGMVSVPNGFGVKDERGLADGLNLNELTSAADRDPFTGCPEHKHVPCRVVRVPQPREGRMGVA